MTDNVPNKPKWRIDPRTFCLMIFCILMLQYLDPLGRWMPLRRASVVTKSFMVLRPDGRPGVNVDVGNDVVALELWGSGNSKFPIAIQLNTIEGAGNIQMQGGDGQIINMGPHGKGFSIHVTDKDGKTIRNVENILEK